MCNVYRTAPAWLVEGQCPISTGARMTSQSGSTNVPTAGSRPRCNRRRAGAAIVALLAVVGGAVVSTTAAA